MEVLKLYLEVGQILHQVVMRGQELMQRRIQQANDDGIAVHGSEQPFEVTALHGQQLSSADWRRARLRP